MYSEREKTVCEQIVARLEEMRRENERRAEAEKAQKEKEEAEA